MSFILDTGSAWTWLPNNSCPETQCTGERYDSINSDTFETTLASKPGEKAKVTEINYSTGRVAGYISKDSFSLTRIPPSDRQIARNIDFVSVFKAESLGNLVSDGVLGMAPSAPVGSKADIFVNELFKQNVIGKNIFSLYFGDKALDQQSVIWFGGFSQTFIRQFKSYEFLNNEEINAKVHWLPLTAREKWQVQMQSVSVAYDQEDQGSKLEGIQSIAAVFDSGSSFIMVPNNDYEIINEAITAGKNCMTDAKGVTGCKCDDDRRGFITIRIKLGPQGQEFQLKPEHYLLQAQDGNCIVAIERESIGVQLNSWVLGTPFLRAYFSIYDLSENQKRVGLLPIESKMEIRDEEWAATPIRKRRDNPQILQKPRRSRTAAYIWIVVVVFLVLVCILLVVFVGKKKVEKDQKPDQAADNENGGQNQNNSEVVRMEQQEMALAIKRSKKESPDKSNRAPAMTSEEAQIAAAMAASLQDAKMRPNSPICGLPEADSPSPVKKAGPDFREMGNLGLDIVDHEEDGGRLPQPQSIAGYEFYDPNNPEGENGADAELKRQQEMAIQQTQLEHFAKLKAEKDQKQAAEPASQVVGQEALPAPIDIDLSDEEEAKE